MDRTRQHGMVPRALHQQHCLYPQEADDGMREEGTQPVHLLLQVHPLEADHMLLQGDRDGGCLIPSTM